MNTEFKIKNNFIVKILDKDTFIPLFKKYREEVFSEDHSLPFEDFISDVEKNKIKELSKHCYDKPFTLYLAVYDEENNFAGWSFGWQENPTTYYMCNSAVLEQYRRRGIYNSLLQINLSILSRQGFQLIYSRHNATNNNVIVPKLKAGFIISKMELSDTFGCLVHLHYYTNATRKKLMDYRCGELAPDKELKKLMEL